MTRPLDTTIRFLWILFFTASFAIASEPDDTDEFVVRQGDKLVVGNREFRFISWNIPNLHYVEDDMRFTQPMPFRWPDAYEIQDALESVRQMGGTVVRTYVLSVRKAEDPPNLPCHVLAPGEFCEEGFKALDTVLAVARAKGIRLIIPFVDNWHWWGGVPQYAAFCGKQTEEFWTDPRLLEDYQQTVRFVINRVNSCTGIAYKDDPTILAWETGNELHCPHSWTRAVAGYIKQLDGRHIVLDGKHTNILEQESIDNPAIDLLQTHHYERSSHEMIEHIQTSARQSRGKKPYHVGEFGFLPTASMTEVIDTIIKEGISGGLIWSLRYHTRDGGFYWHHEPFGGDLFKAYHWPGFPSGQAYDERNFLNIVRSKAYAIRGLPEPPRDVPDSPTQLQVTPGGLITWRGSTGASGYDIQRADAPSGDWQTVGENISDAENQHHPHFADRSVKIGACPLYRVIARNQAGASQPSSLVAEEQQITITHNTLVDELRDKSILLDMQGDLEFQQNQARKFKEDAHRLVGNQGARVTWRTPQRMIGAKFYLFAEHDMEVIQAMVSADGRHFESIQLDKQTYPIDAAGTYGYWLPILYSCNGLTGDVQYLRIEFKELAHLARVELSYRAR
ncbi:MAG: cellulase family glycosylhydrolase [Pirellulales bacterium]|nr:cellulase family glycosylhydrolase [Pirellulales bacterium]